MINLTKLRRFHEAATEGPWAWDEYGGNPDKYRVIADGHALVWLDHAHQSDLASNAALIALAPDLAAAVLDHPAALRAALLRGYEVALEEAYRNGIGLPRADKCAALLDILKEYPDETV